MTATATATAVIAAARELAGSTEDDPRYDEAVDPAGSAAEEAQIAREVSSCMLDAAYVLGWRGRFVPSTIPATLRGLWGGGTGRVPDEYAFCDLGAQIWWAKSATADEHVDLCVIAVERTSLDVVTLTVIAGGQRVTAEDVASGLFTSDQLGKRCVKSLRRAVQWNGSAWVDTTPNGRHVLGVHDALPAATAA